MPTIAIPYMVCPLQNFPMLIKIKFGDWITNANGQTFSLVDRKILAQFPL